MLVYSKPCLLLIFGLIPLLLRSFRSILKARFLIWNNAVFIFTIKCAKGGPMMKQICRLDKTNKRPYCLRKPCSYKADGTCSGPVTAVKEYYGLHSCPGDPDPGETPRCGRYAECAYCRVGHRRK